MIYKEIVIESFAVTDMTAMTSAILFLKVRAAVSTPMNALNIKTDISVQSLLIKLTSCGRFCLFLSIFWAVSL